ncbi:transposable element Tcb2 transposase [Trichonephila clavipes]|nr:transposable element Tcb2 transposase [Trichonephila clavipes]
MTISENTPRTGGSPVEEEAKRERNQSDVTRARVEERRKGAKSPKTRSKSTKTQGSLIGDRYCEKVLFPHVCLFRSAIGPDFIFMDDDARPHRTLAVEELLELEDITRMD